MSQYERNYDIKSLFLAGDLNPYW